VDLSYGSYYLMSCMSAGDTVVKGVGDLPAAPHAKVVGSMAASMVAVGRIHIVASALAGIDAYGMVWYGMYRLLSGA
jgi:hypothetical protein